MGEANLVAYSDLFQLLGMFSGVWLAILSLAAGWFIWDSNRRDKRNESQHKTTEAANERRIKEAGEANAQQIKELEGTTERRFKRMEEHTDRRFKEMEERTDRRFKEMEERTERRFKRMEESTDRRFKEMEDASERRHQEVMKAITLLYRHVHDETGAAIIPLSDIEPAAPAPGTGTPPPAGGDD